MTSEIDFLNIFLENFLFFAIATSFFLVTGWAWRNTKPYDLPKPLPNWFRIWFLTMQIGGIILPLVGLVWVIWQGYFSAAIVLISYFFMLGLQILSESLSLRWFHSFVFVMIPYLYLPYRVWQLYQGLMLLNPVSDLAWIRNLLFIEIVLWTGNYALDLSQLPRLVRWEVREEIVSR
ncbi:hypothetical protein DA73_0400021695 [Tolypothrix bouteillei VB521301]|uniref:Uncharacterized protein n=1 Tax=Tolypothrix bouteillei VB521301 TaxID=1479485 RepID=A0A0C1NKT2_9CYAN|nr:hypothetical protein [Tolypothrix bouteillei]KAF3891061.1 hypothetical protein DA73_0400021695 [Tolypothrix bouteillei VB521301]